MPSFAALSLKWSLTIALISFVNGELSYLFHSKNEPSSRGSMVFRVTAISSLTLYLDNILYNL